MRASLTFLRCMAETPMADIAGTETGNLDLESREVDLADADSLSPAPTLESHGFQAVPFSPGNLGPATARDQPAQFAQLCCAAIRRHTGAARVVLLPGTVQVRRSDAAKPRAPLVVSHSDFTPVSAASRAARIAEMLAMEQKPARFAAFNAWWLARAGPQDRPLALCDPNSVDPADLQVGRVRVLNPDKTVIDFGQIAYQHYHPRHRWYWYPRLAPDRLLLFCGFDSNGSRPSMVTHCAFTNPECPPGAPPRVSIECRLMAFW